MPFSLSSILFPGTIAQSCSSSLLGKVTDSQNGWEGFGGDLGGVILFKDLDWILTFLPALGQQDRREREKKSILGVKDLLVIYYLKLDIPLK